jgi:hypothetical protein
MATTIIAQPQVLMPAYNPIKYIIDNADKNEPGFRYIFTIYPATGSHIPANVVAQYKTLPVYGTGYGEQDISKLMQSKVGFDTSAFGLDSAQATNSWYQYDIDLGYEYIDNINYGTSLADNGGNVQISFTAHGFVQGDQISITQDDLGVANPGVEGLHTVLSATANNFTINALYADVTDVTINGTVTYADLRKTIVLDDEAIVDREVFNGAYNNNINVSDNTPFPYNDFYGVAVDGNLLTSLVYSVPPSTFLNAYFYLNLRVYQDIYSINYYDMSNTFLDNYLVNVPADGIHTFSVGPTALVTEDYYVVISNSLGFISEHYLFTYDNRCTINDDQLIYLDRMGSWQSFAFQLKTYEKGQITREQYNQHIDGQVVSTEWVGVPLQTGFRTYNTNVTKTFDLNTNWMNENDGKRFQELLTSPQVYYYTDNYYCACVVEATNFEVFRQRNKNLIKQSVTIRLAQQDPING